MSAFFWSAGHLGWGVFLVAVYTCICLLVGDLVWRLVTAKARTLIAVLGLVWVLGGVVILVALH